MNVCPECDGQQMLDHPAGILTFQHRLDCGLLTAEDATAHADHLRLGSGAFTRTATATERALLDSMGFVIEDVELTYVERVTNSVRRREWTDLERIEDAPPAA